MVEPCAMYPNLYVDGIGVIHGVSTLKDNFSRVLPSTLSIEGHYAFSSSPYSFHLRTMYLFIFHHYAFNLLVACIIAQQKETITLKDTSV